MLIPKLAHNFVIKTTDPRLAILTELLVSIDMGAEDLTMSEPVHRTGKIILWLTDDSTCRLMTSLRDAQRDPLPFDLEVTLLNPNNEILETYGFIDCSLQAIQHSMLNYASGGDQIDLTVMQDQTENGLTSLKAVASIQGKLSRTDSNHFMMKLLQIGFHAMTHTIATEKVQYAS